MSKEKLREISGITLGISSAVIGLFLLWSITSRLCFPQLGSEYCEELTRQVNMEWMIWSYVLSALVPTLILSIIILYLTREKTKSV